MAKRAGIILHVSPVFYSENDERAYVDWIGRLSFLSANYPEFTHGTLRMLKRPNRSELRDLIALFIRYQLPAWQLAVFETAANRGWFRRRGMYWYDEVFGKAALTRKRLGHPALRR